MRVLAVYLLLLPATALSAAADLSHCVNINDALERLACYDTAAGRNATAMTPSAASIAPAAEPPPVAASQRAPQPVPAPSSTPAVTAVPLAVPDPAPAPAAPPTRVSKPDDEFGDEQLRDDQKQEIVTRYDGEFTGWSGRTVFKLENGQVWKQAESGRFRTSMDRPVIRIQRGAFGSYRLKVEGLNRSIRVKRIR